MVILDDFGGSTLIILPVIYCSVIQSLLDQTFRGEMENHNLL